MDEILRIARKHNLYVIEDAACALGARYKIKRCGAIGDLGCFSFHPRKIISTGEGGAVVTNSLSLVKRLKLLREHGMKQYGTKRSFILLGLNYRISEIASVLGLAQLEKIEMLIRRRTKINDMFRRIISRINVLSVVPAYIDKHSRAAYQDFIVKINKNINIFKLISFLKERGIESTISNTAVHTQPYYQRKYGFRKGELKNSLFAFKRSITLPFHCRMTEKDITKVVNALGEYFNEKK